MTTLSLAFPFRGGLYGTFVGADPAAGTEVSVTVPAGVVWILQSVSVLLVQGLTQTPQPILQIDDGTNVLAESVGSTVAQPVSTTCRYVWAPFLGIRGSLGTGADVHTQAPLPWEIPVLHAGAHIKTYTLGIGAGSDYGPPSLYVIEYTS